MKALRFTGDQLKLDDIPLPRANDEALVRVIKSGICSTDLEIVRGYAGFQGTIGHEFVGVVEASSDSPHLIGRRVVGEINVGCGFCELCIDGDSRHCATRTVLGIHGRDGCHAEFLTLPTRNLVAVPDTVSDDRAVFIEPLAAACGIMEQVEVFPEMKIAVIGDGRLGMLCAMSLALESNNVSLIGKHPSKLAIAEKSDIETILLENVAEKLKRRFDVVIEATGAESGFTTAVELIKPRGKIVLKSTFHGTPTWEASKVVVHEITVIGSRCGRFAPAVALLANKQIQVDELISEEYKLEDGVKAIERAGQKGVMKVLLNMGS